MQDLPEVSDLLHGLYVDPTGKQEWGALTFLLAKVLMSCA